MNQGDVYLNKLLESYKYQLRSQRRELRQLPEGHLYVRRQNGRVQLMRETLQRDGGKTVRVRQGITKNEQLSKQLARKAYLVRSTKLLQEEIRRLERFVESSRPPSVTHILESLPESYKQLPQELFLPEKKRAGRWSTNYEQSTYRVHEKIHSTKHGLKVRSKSELLIADKLEVYELHFQYEGIIKYRQYTFSPDFSIMTTQGIVYWEHCGMMTDPNYKRRNEWKLQIYDKMGIVPWKNLIVTYDTEDGGLDLRIIESEIVNKLLPIKI